MNITTTTERWAELVEIQREFISNGNPHAAAEGLLYLAMAHTGSSCGLYAVYTPNNSSCMTPLAIKEDDELGIGESQLVQFAREFKTEDERISIVSHAGFCALAIPLASSFEPARGILIVAGSCDYPSDLSEFLSAITRSCATVMESFWLRKDFQTALQGSNVGAWNWNLQTNNVIYSSEWKRQLGFEDHELPNHFDEWYSRLHPDDMEAALTSANNAIAQRTANYVSQFRMRHRDGSWRWILASGFVVCDTSETPVRMLGVHVDVTQHSRMKETFERQNRVLEQIAFGESLSVVLREISDLVEQAIPDSYCSLLSLDDDQQRLRIEVSNRLPAAYNAAIDGITMGPQAGSCGTAAFRREPVIVADIASDPLWKNFAALALSFGLRSCWSVPVFTTATDKANPKQQLLGTFAVYRTTPSSPTDEEFRMMSRAAYLAGIAISRDQAEASLRIKETRYRSIAELVSTYSYEIEIDQKHNARIHWVSESYEEVTGFRIKDLTGDGWTNVFYPDDLPLVIDTINQLLDGPVDQVRTLEFRLKTAWGKLLWIQSVVQCVRDDKHTGRLLRGTSVDITERKQAELALRESETRFRALFDHSADSIVLCGPGVKIIDVNQHAIESLGYSRDELIGQHPTLFDPDLTPELLAEITPKLQAGKTVTFDVNHRRKDGSRYPAEVRVRPFMIDGVRFTVSIIRDMTERKKAEEELRASKRFIERIAQASPLTMYVFNVPQQEIVYINRQTAADLGFTTDEIMADPNGLFFKLMHPDDKQLLQSLLTRWKNAKDSEVLETEYRLRDKYGKWHWFLSRDTVFSRTEDGNVLEIVGTAQDITNWKQVEEILRESEARMRTLLENLDNVAVQGYEPDGRITFWNHASEKLYGYSAAEVIGRDIVDLLHGPATAPTERAIMAKMLRTQQLPPVDEVQIVDRENRRRWVLANRVLHPRPGRQPEFFCFDVDITLRKEAEEKLALRQMELFHASRLSTVGQMVAGLSHEVAQPLSAIGNLATAGITQLKNPTPDGITAAIDYLEIISRQNERCGAILQRLRDFSRRTPTILSRCQLNQLVQDSLLFMAHDCHRNQTVTFVDLSPEEIVIFADRIQFEQVMVNLLSNALDALQAKESSQRIIRVKTWTEGAWACVSVADCGEGLGDNHEKLFEPFFTTKANGMGIGLSIVRTIVNDHRGSISAQNNQYGGATFVIQIPRTSETTNDLS